MTPNDKWRAWRDSLTYDMQMRSDPTNMGRIPWFVQNPWDAQVPEDYLNVFGSDYAGIVAAQKAAWEQHTGFKYDPTAAYNAIDGLGRRTAKGVLLTPEAWENNPGPRPTEQIHFVGNRTPPPAQAKASQSRTVPAQKQTFTSAPNSMPAFNMAPAPAPASAPAPTPTPTPAAAAPAPAPAAAPAAPKTIVPNKQAMRAEVSRPTTSNTYNRRTL